MRNMGIRYNLPSVCANKEINMKNGIWDNCKHEWNEVVDSQFHSEWYVDVRCGKCGCPGERDKHTQKVFWPAT